MLVSSRRDLTIGDIVIKGAIGLAVDAGTGASHEYPSSITLHLPPVSFDSAEERDRHYDRVKAKVSEDAAAALARIENNCSKPLTRRCGNKIKAVENRPGRGNRRSRSQETESQDRGRIV